MAAPQRRYQARPSNAGSYARPEERRINERTAAGRRPRRRKLGAPHRRFLVLVVVPVLLMLGSIYSHAVAANLGGKAEQLKGEISRAADDRQRLDVQVAQLSSPGRILKLAREDLHMRQPGGEDLRIYSDNGEDARRNGGEQAKENR